VPFYSTEQNRNTQYLEYFLLFLILDDCILLRFYQCACDDEEDGGEVFKFLLQASGLLMEFY
jgi:hypothetical protein